MTFVIRSGTSIREYVEKRCTPGAALECAERWLRQKLPNVRIEDAHGNLLDIVALRDMGGRRSSGRASSSDAYEC
jgi:hypothetical protein